MEPGIIFGGKPIRLIGQGDRDADVRLMAMAPELLERLTGLMHRLETIRETDKTGLALDEDIESARAVIGRASPAFGLTLEGLQSWASARLKQVKVNVAARDLVKLVEDGQVEYEGWISGIDAHRLKDTEQWCVFYSAVQRLDEDPVIASRCAKLAEMEGDESPSACGPEMLSGLSENVKVLPPGQGSWLRLKLWSFCRSAATHCSARVMCADFFLIARKI